MKKHNQNNKTTTGLRLAEAAVYLLNLVLLGYVSLPFIAVHPSYVEPFATILRFGALGTFALAFVATLIALRGQASRLLLWATRFLAGVTGVVFVYLTYGLIRDLVGVRCIGLFGSTQTCVDSAIFGIRFALPSPYVFIPIALVFGVMAIVGIVQSLQRRS